MLLCLLAEAGMLVWGYWTHLHLHHSAATQRWAINRFVAEINRSVLSVAGVHMYLEYLFRLKLPPSFRALMRTINVLHLRSSNPKPKWFPGDDRWQAIRDHYLEHRLRSPQSGQIEYYRRSVQTERDQRGLFQRIFAVCSVLAILATFSEIIIVGAPGGASMLSEPASAAIGVLTVVLPVLAVGVLSWSAAMDYTARVNIFREMENWLKDQADRIQDTKSEHEFMRLAATTELRLLGETAEWYSRRSYTGVQ